MKKGQIVGLICTDGVRRSASIMAVTGAGKSTWKTLDVQYKQDGELVELKDVPHENDAVAGEPFWLEVGVQRSKDIVAPPEEEEATDAAAELAEANGVDLSDVKGTGVDGRILKSDVQKYIDEN